MSDYRESFIKMVKFINDNFIAEVQRNVYNPGNCLDSIIDDKGNLNDSERFIPVTTTLSLLNACIGNNTLIEGGSGTGKTKLAGVIGSMLFQIPYELFEVNRVVGNPGATVNEIYATHDIAELNKGNNVAFLYLPFQMPFIIIDELNRFSSLEQNRIREGIATGVWSYAGHSWKIPKQVVVSAVNPEVYGGTFGLNENLLDNYSIIVEPVLYDSTAHEELVINAEDKIRELLGLEGSIDEIINDYSKNKNDPVAISKKIADLQDRTVAEFKKRGLLFVHNGDLDKIKSEIDNVSFTPEANLFKYSLLAEMTYSSQFGRLRLEDPDSLGSHDKNYLSGLLKEPIAGRFLKDWLNTARMIAWYFGKGQADVDELKAAFIYTAPRRLKPNLEFYQKVLNEPRELPVNFQLAKETVDTAWEHYSSFKGNNNNDGFNMARKAIRILTGDDKGALEDDKGDLSEAIKILKIVDHPIAKSLLISIAENIKNKKQVS